MQRWFLIFLKLAVTALVFILIARQVDVRSTAHTLSTISLYAVLAGIIAILAQSLAAAGRLVMVVARFGRRFRLNDAYRVTLESMFFSQTFISFLGGDVLRVWRIRQLGLEFPKATSAVVLDRLIGTVVNHVFVLATLPWFLSSDTSGSIKITLVVMAAAGVVGFALVLLLGYLRGRADLLARLPARFRGGVVMAFVVECSTVGHYLLERRRGFAWVFALSALITIANMLVFALILRGMGVPFALAVGCALLVPAIMEIAMLPVSLAGWGIREGAAIVGFGTLGLPTDQALGASIAFGLILAAVSILGGLLWLVDRRQMTQTSMDVSDKSREPHSLTR
jgi:uncharacterized membrane protein YbhN (UPF0104 family)